MEKQKVAIITGAARGIGAAAAVELGRRGYRLTLIDRLSPDVAAITSQAGCDKTNVLSLTGDLADLAFAESTVEATWKQWGRIDALVNNASWREVVSIRHITIESWEKTLRLGLTTPAFMARWATRYMEQQKSGVIVNISSVMAEHAGGFSPAYIASKGAINSLTYELASLYGPSGIRMVYIEPGSPWQNGYAESFHSRLRSELLDAEIFENVREAQSLAVSWHRLQPLPTAQQFRLPDPRPVRRRVCCFRSGYASALQQHTRGQEALPIP